MPFSTFNPPPAPTEVDWSQHMDPVSTPDIGGYFGPRTTPRTHPFLRLMTLGLAWVSGKAAKNHYDFDTVQRENYYLQPSNSDTAPVGRVIDAAEIGMAAFARWAVWLGAICTNVWTLLWCIGMLYTAATEPLSVANGNDVALWLACSVGILVAWPFTIGMTWCRNIDFCLFRRGIWYKLFQRFDRGGVANVSMWLLYGAVAAPFVACWWQTLQGWNIA